MNTIHYNLVFQPEPEGGFTVTVPTLPGCITYGKDLNEAKEMALDAIQAYIASLRADGEEIPTDNETFTSFAEIKIKATDKILSYA